MYFDKYKEKNIQTLIAKARNNLAREAIIKLKEIDPVIQSTNESSVLFLKMARSLRDCGGYTILGQGAH